MSQPTGAIPLDDIVGNPNLQRFLTRCWYGQDEFLSVTVCNQKLRGAWSIYRRIIIEGARRRRELFERLRLDTERYPQPFPGPAWPTSEIAFRARWLQTHGMRGSPHDGAPWGNMLGALLDLPEIFSILYGYWRKGSMYVLVTTLTGAYHDKWGMQREEVILQYQRELADQRHLDSCWWWPSVLGDPDSDWD